MASRESQAIALVMSVALIGVLIMASLDTSPADQSLYDRLGGIYPIAAVIDRFSDSLINNDVVGVDSKNPALREWHRNKLDRLPGLNFMRILWVATLTGGPFTFHRSQLQACPVAGKTSGTMNLRKAHCSLKISSAEFDAVAAELADSLDHFKVPAREKNEVLGAFAAHKSEVVTDPDVLAPL